MRINKFVAQATGLSRRKADELIASGEITVNGSQADPGYNVSPSDTVKRGRQELKPVETVTTIMLNKPVGYVCSRDGQGSKTVYDLLPKELHNLKPVGRLDKDSSGLLLLTNNGGLANELTHPKFQKEKVYEVELDKPLQPGDEISIEMGITLEDGHSELRLSGRGKNWIITMSEGRNRQIRRTFDMLGYTVAKLHRTKFGPHHLGDLKTGKFINI